MYSVCFELETFTGELDYRVCDCFPWDIVAKFTTFRTEGFNLISVISMYRKPL